VIIPKQDLLELTGIADSVSFDLTHQGVEQEIKNYCGWELESKTYTNIAVDGSGGDYIWPGHKNITALVRAATGKRAAINIKHGTASSNAYAKVTYTDLVPTSLELVVGDGSDAGDSSDAFSDYATLTLLVDQINDNSADWSAELYNSNYGVFASTNLLEVDSLMAGTEDGGDPGWTELQMPGEALKDVTVERTEGGLYRSAGWPSGNKNIPLTYIAGWTTANMPSDLKQAVAILVQFFWNKQSQAGFGAGVGVKGFSLGQLRIEYAQASSSEGGAASSIPIEVLNVLDMKYRIKVIV